jgi:hypothetical protein
MDTLVADLDDETTKEFLLYLNDKGFSDKVEDFFHLHCESFPDLEYVDPHGEQDNEHYELYLEFQGLIEKRMASYCDEVGMSHAALMKHLRESCEEQELCMSIIDMVISAMEFPLFLYQMSAVKLVARQQQQESKHGGK